MNEYTELNQPLQTSEIFSDIPPEITIPLSTLHILGKSPSRHENKRSDNLVIAFFFL